MSFKPADQILKIRYFLAGFKDRYCPPRELAVTRIPLQVPVIVGILRQGTDVIGRNPLFRREQRCRRSAVWSLLLGTGFAQSVAWIWPNHVHHLSKPLLFVWCQYNGTALVSPTPQQLAAAKRKSCHTRQSGAISNWMSSTSLAPKAAYQTSSARIPPVFFISSDDRHVSALALKKKKKSLRSSVIIRQCSHIFWH